MIPLYDDNPTRRTPYVTILLLAANVIVYFFVQPHGLREEQRFLYERAAVPCEVTTGEPVEVQGRRVDCDLPAGEQEFPEKNVYLAVLVSMFLHANLLHLGGNMLFLWVFGNNVEDEMGHIPFLVFYVVCGVIAALAHIFLFRSSAIPVIGASGAIAGVMGAYLLRFPRARVLTLVPIFIFFTFWLPAWIVLVLWFIGQFGISTAESGVATAAHIGGFVAGAAIALVFGMRSRPAPPPPPPAWFSRRY